MPHSFVRALFAASVLFSVASSYADMPLEIWKSLPVNLAPGSSLTQSLDGNFYGTCTPSDLAGDRAGGLLYSLSPTGQFRVVHYFQPNSDGNVANNGSFPTGRLISCDDGSVIGFTEAGGAYANGVIYRLSTSGEYTVLFDFPRSLINGPDYLFRASNGDFWGHGGGHIFRWTLDGSFTIYHRFPIQAPTVPAGSPRPPHDLTAIAEGPDGKVYGLTSGGGPTYTTFHSFMPYEVTRSYGTFFRVDGVEQITILKEFDSQFHSPWSLMLGPDGNFYGTSNGYLYDRATSTRRNRGFVYRITPEGVPSFLHEFMDQTEGEYPGGLIAGSDGNLYGECMYGGAQYGGTIFRISLTGEYSTLHNFGPFEGGRAGITEAADGSLYEVIQRIENTELQDQTGLRTLRTRRSYKAGQIVRFPIQDEPANRPPMARGEMLTTRQFIRDRATGQLVATFSPLANDRDADGDSLIVAETTPASRGTVSFDPVTNKMAYRPSASILENDSFTYTVSDGKGGSTAATVRITTNPNGIYTAPLLEAGNQVGTLKIRVVAQRIVTGTVVLDGKTRRLAGRVDTDGRFRKAFRARDGQMFGVELRLVPSGGDWEIAATVRDNTDIFTATLR